MMVLWLLFGGLTILVLAALLLPLLRVRPAAPSRGAYDLQVYRRQLGELERDQERGLLAADQSDAARTEIQRHILAAADTETAAPATTTPSWRLAGLLLVAVPMLAGALYLALGSPSLPDRPFAGRASDPSFQMGKLADQLAAHLKVSPDGEGYRRLGETYLMLDRFAEAAAAYQQAVALGLADSGVLSGQAEALALANDGMVVPDARRLFLQALAKDPDNPQARFYLGLAQAQIGAFEKAVAIWRDLETSSPANAPWLPTLRQHIADVARQGGFDATAITPAAPSPPGNGAEAAAAPAMPGGAAAAAIAQQSPADQAKTIRAMVDGLATRLQSQPDDYDGWMRLAKSYKVLGERDKAIAAARHAIGLRPTEIEPRLALAQIQLGDATDTALPGDFLATLKDVLAIDGDDATALYYLGIAAAASHQPAEARRLWQKLLTHLPAEGTERVEVDRRLQALD